ncbi:D-amino-acid transaminase [Lysinibacillus sp. NPDC097279]|uniref:D-amino-acid transaminase n=1 Tax=Lysinibacillus sp. NPDC097279 TaxID=3364143 RepID=UPI003803532E
MGYSLWNDRIVLDKEVIIDREDRGYQFGDGVYEVIKVYDGIVFTLNEHLERFYTSAEKIKLMIPYKKDKLFMLLRELVQKNNIGTGHIYLQITRGSGSRQHHFPENMTPVLVANVKENPRPLANFENGVKATILEDIRWLRCDIKTLNLLGPVLAKQEAYEKGCYEAILHRNGVVTEGASSNVHGILDGVLYTHQVDNMILNGITRSVLLACAKEIGLPVKEQAFTLEQLTAMTEVIITSTTSEITPVIEIDDYVFGTGKPGEWTRKLQQQFNAKISELVRS